jgi:hypothetical protein
MVATTVQAPASLLLHRELAPSAKLLWLLLRLHGEELTFVPACTGLSLPTVRKGLGQLTAEGWGTTVATCSGSVAGIPGALLGDRRLGIQARLLYGLLQLTPGFHDSTGKFTYASLSHLANCTLPTVKRATGQLVNERWLRVAQTHQRAPVRFALRDPVVARGEDEVAEAELRLAEASFRGEELMREFLSLLIDSNDFQDDATPGFLVNPETGHRMQLDRFYHPHVAFEFNGTQHYPPTPQFSQMKVNRQRARDYMKLGICLTEGITIVIVHAEDLSLEALRQKVGALLPLRDLAGHEKLIAFLNKLGRGYRLAAKRKGQ